MTEQPRSSFIFRLELGALMRDDAIFQIRCGALRAGVKCEIVENKGFFESNYQIRITGSIKKVRAFHEILQAWDTNLNY